MTYQIKNPYFYASIEFRDMFSYFKEKTPKDNVSTVAFYNLENLFDIYDDPKTYDDDFTPTGEKKWTYKRYKNKIKRLSQVILKIGVEHATTPPILIGIAELENKSVISDLVSSKYLRDFNYDYVHYDSPDERGIDVALIYLKEHFELLESKAYPLLLRDVEGKRDFTRDILLVKGKLKGELVYVVVNHWPSRREGQEESEIKSIAAAKRVQEIVADIKAETDNPKIIIMGDFNDGYDSSSIKSLVNDTFYNPMERLKAKGKGTSVYNNEWFLFDQIIISKNFLTEQPNTHTFKYADVYDPKFIRTWRGKHKNDPYRTYIGRWHQGGYSDHFPVYLYLEKMV